MLITIPDVLNAEQVVLGRKLLDGAEWVDGGVTAGHQLGRMKDNVQIPKLHPIAQQAAGRRIVFTSSVKF